MYVFHVYCVSVYEWDEWPYILSDFIIGEWWELINTGVWTRHPQWDGLQSWSEWSPDSALQQCWTANTLHAIWKLAGMSRLYSKSWMSLYWLCKGKITKIVHTFKDKEAINKFSRLISVSQHNLWQPRKDTNMDVRRSEHPACVWRQDWLLNRKENWQQGRVQIHIQVWHQGEL